MDINKAYEVEQGFLVEDGPFYTGGTASPVGQGMPVETIYIQTDPAGHFIWKKVGAGDTASDWRKYSAQDVPFDNAGIKFNATDTFDAIKEVRANSVFSLDALTSSIGGNHNIEESDANIHIVRGSATGYSVTLPDATNLFLGRRFEIVNESSETISIKDDSGTILTSLIVGDSGSFTLETNSIAAGTWLATIVTSAATGITSYVVTSDINFNTTSSADTIITGFTVTPVPGRYAALFASDVVIGGNNALADYILYVDGSAVENTRRTAQGVSSNFVTSFNTIGEINVDGSDTVDIRVNISTSDLDINSRSLILIRLGGAIGV